MLYSEEKTTQVHLAGIESAFFPHPDDIGCIVRPLGRGDFCCTVDIIRARACEGLPELMFHIFSDNCSKLGRTPTYYFFSSFCSEPIEYPSTSLREKLSQFQVLDVSPRGKRCCMVCFVTRVHDYVGRTCPALLHIFSCRFLPLLFLGASPQFQGIYPFVPFPPLVHALHFGVTGWIMTKRS